MDLYARTAIIILGAAVLVGVLRRLGQSAIVAYLLLGVLVGPSLCGVMRADDSIQHLAETGVVFLLFFIGLEFDLRAVRKLARLATGGAALQIGFTAAILGGLGLLLGLSPTAAWLLGFAGALSSTAIVMKAFEERGEDDSVTAQASLAILLGQDLLALLGVAALPVLLAGGATGSGSLLRLFGTFAGLPVLFFTARLVLLRLFQRAALERNQEAFALASLGSCLAVAVVAQVLGASLAFGAFLGGLVFAGTPYAHQIRADLATLKDLALGFFFVTVGMLADLRYGLEHWLLVLVAVPILLAVKTVVTAVTLRVLRHPWSVAAGAGLAISQVGEFAFVLASTARSAGALGPEEHQLLIALSVLTMMLAPALVTWSRRFGQAASGWLGQPVPREWGRRAVPDRQELSEETQTLTRGARAVVVGYGPVGRTLCKILIRFGIRPTVIELNLERVQRLRQMGREAIYGDAGQREVLHAAGVAHAGHLLITLPNLTSRIPIIASARALNPDIHILTRARYLEERKILEEAGAQAVAFEEAEVASELARLLLTNLGVAQDQIGPEIERLRSEIALRTGFTMIGPKGQTVVRDVE